MLSYPVRLAETPAGKVRVVFLDVPEAVAEADKRADALYQAKFALELSLGNYVLHGRDIPVPSDVPDAPMITTDKFALPKSGESDGSGSPQPAAGDGRY